MSMATLTHYQFRSAELQEKVDQWMAESGMSLEDIIEQAVEDYFDNWREVGEILEKRMEDLRSGRDKGVSPEEVFGRLREMSASLRAQKTRG